MRSFATILCIAALAVITGPALAAPVLESPGILSLPAGGSTVSLTINLSGAETGLSGYNLSLAMTPSRTAEIVSVEYPPWANMPMNGTMPAWNTWIQAVDLQTQVEPGDSPVLLATLTLRAIANDKTVLTVAPVIVDDDRGGRYTLDPIQIPVQVGAVPAETTSQSTSSADPQASSSSSTDAPKATAALRSPPGNVVSDTTQTVTTPASSQPSPSLEIPAEEQTAPPARTSPGFGWSTSCLTGLVLGALVLLKMKKGE
jgi:hypothetical protein